MDANSTVRLVGQNAFCQHCKTTLVKITDEFEPPGTFYHPMDAWWMDMKPLIVPSKITCPNAGKKFRFQSVQNLDKRERK